MNFTTSTRFNDGSLQLDLANPTYITIRIYRPGNPVYDLKVSKPMRLFGISKKKRTLIIVLSVVIPILVIAVILIIIFFCYKRFSKKNKLSGSSTKTSVSFKHQTPEASIDIDQMTPTLRSTENTASTDVNTQNPVENQVNT